MVSTVTRGHIGILGPCCSWGLTDLRKVLVTSGPQRLMVTSESELWPRAKSESVLLLQPRSVLKPMACFTSEDHRRDDPSGLGQRTDNPLTGHLSRRAGPPPGSGEIAMTLDSLEKLPQSQ